VFFLGLFNLYSMKVSSTIQIFLILIIEIIGYGATDTKKILIVIYFIFKYSKNVTGKRNKGKYI
jgi:hypothetical protein